MLAWEHVADAFAKYSRRVKKLIRDPRKLMASSDLVRIRIS